MSPVQLAVCADQGFTVLAVDAFLVVMVLAKVPVSLRCPSGLRPAAQQSKVLSQRRDVSVLDVVYCLACGAFELVGGVGGTWVVTCCGPLSTCIADVEDHLLILVLIRLHIEQLIQALCRIVHQCSK